MDFIRCRPFLSDTPGKVCRIQKAGQKASWSDNTSGFTFTLISAMHTHSDRKPLRFSRLTAEQLEERHLLAALPLAAGAEIPYVSAAEILAADDPFTADPLPGSASGEFQTETYYNVKKSRNETDSKLCWAASASNILAYTNWGYAISVSGTEAETGLFSTEQEIYDYFVSNFTNAGANLSYAFRWFTEGLSASSSFLAQPVGDGGGLYPGISYSQYLTTFSSGVYKGALLQSALPLLEEGYGIEAAIGWYTQSAPKTRTGGHALTVWGYTYDDDLDPSDPNYYTGLIVTNSDDAAKTPELIPIEWNEEYSMYHLTHFWFAKGWIEQMACIKPVEPLTCITASGYDGYYDGKAHTVTVNGLNLIGSKGYTVYYTYAGETSTHSPRITDAGNYSVRVVVVSKDQSAVWSAPVEVNICTENSGKLPAPTIISAVSTGDNGFKVSWSPMPGAANYELVSLSDEGTVCSRLITADPWGLLTDLDYEKEFTCRVRALGDEINTTTGNWSAEAELDVNPVDLDWDGFIGPGDFSLISTVWFSSEGNENWDPRYDIDGDGFIGPGDYTYLSANWFKTTDHADFRYPSV